MDSAGARLRGWGVCVCEWNRSLENEGSFDTEALPCSILTLVRTQGDFAAMMLKWNLEVQ